MTLLGALMYAKVIKSNFLFNQKFLTKKASANK